MPWFFGAQVLESWLSSIEGKPWTVQYGLKHNQNVGLPLKYNEWIPVGRESAGASILV